MTLPLAFILGCSATKAPRGPARSFYRGNLFRAGRNLASHLGARWWVLSAKYGLVEPGQVLESYDRAMMDLTASERIDWDKRVRRQLSSLPKIDSLVVLASGKYTRGLGPALKSLSVQVHYPMSDISNGLQLGLLRQLVTEVDFLRLHGLDNLGAREFLDLLAKTKKPFAEKMATGRIKSAQTRERNKETNGG